jgi:cephalosporin-C deacetylase
MPEMKLCVPDFPYMSDYKRVWEMDLDVDCYKGIRYYLRHFDPRHERVDEFFEKLGYVDIQNLAPRIKAKVLMGTGLLDNICPPSTQFAMFNKITSEKEVIIYPDFGHEGLGGHDDLVFEFIKENL